MKNLLRSCPPVALTALFLSVAPVAGQGAPSLEAWGIAPGGTQAQLQQRITAMGGKLLCKTSPVDHRFTECTAASVRADGRTWDLTASLVGGMSGVLLFRTALTESDVKKLRDRWIAAFGRPNLSEHRGEASYQWIRGGRMLRLTTRSDDGRADVLVSLIQGDVLDGIGTAP